MAVNKNFVVKNGLEVDTNLILANADTNKVGIGTTVPRYTLHVHGPAAAVGGIGATNITVSGIGTFENELRIGVGGTVFSVIAGPSGVGQSVGIRTAEPAFLLDVRSPVSTGQTALYVQGDVRFTGITTTESTLFADQLSVLGISTFVGFATFSDYVYVQDGLNVTGTGITANTLNVTGVSTHVGFSTFNDYVYVQDGLDVTGTGITATTLNVTGVSTFVGFSTFNDYVYIQDGLDVTGTGITVTTLNVTGVSTFGDNVYISGITSVGTAITMYPSSGIVSATAYYGDGSNLTGVATEFTATIGISSGGTVIGTGITVVDYRMTNGTLTVAVPPETAPGIATVTINPQVSLGLVIALGG